jgi:hypothetical protein
MSVYSWCAIATSGDDDDRWSNPEGIYADINNIRCPFDNSNITPTNRPDIERLYARHQGDRCFDISNPTPASWFDGPGDMISMCCRSDDVIVGELVIAGSPISCSAMISNDNDIDRSMIDGSLRVKPQPILNVAMRNGIDEWDDGSFIQLMYNDVCGYIYIYMYVCMCMRNTYVMV